VAGILSFILDTTQIVNISIKDDSTWKKSLKDISPPKKQQQSKVSIKGTSSTLKKEK